MEATPVEAPPAAGTWKRRLVVVAGAVLAAVVVYLVTTLVAGQELSSPAMNDQQPADVTIGAVIVASALVSLLGWGLLALLEKFTAKARTIWTVVALVVLALSLGGPLSGTDVSTGNRVGLVLLHLAVAAVLIPLLPGAWAREGRQAS
jgi:hypothetical protein